MQSRAIEVFNDLPENVAETAASQKPEVRRY
jgi:hypothetical protein